MYRWKKTWPFASQRRLEPPLTYPEADRQPAETLKTPGLQWQGSNSIDSKSKLTGLLSMTNCSGKRSCHGAERACVLPGCVSLSKSESGCTGLRHLAAVVAQIRFKKKKKKPQCPSLSFCYFIMTVGYTERRALKETERSTWLIYCNTERQWICFN